MIARGMERTLKWFVLVSFAAWTACGKAPAEVIQEQNPETPAPTLADIRKGLVDREASDETAALFHNLKKTAEEHILFGHQDATKRGVEDQGLEWANERHLPTVSNGKSDIRTVTGAYPAVYGHDFDHIAGFFEPDHSWFAYEKEIARQLTIEAYNRGGINTYSWHYANPVSKGSFYWDDSPVRAVNSILPGGSHHEVYKTSLQTIAGYAKSLIGADGALVPVIFRPFHEFDGDWFWWGRAHCTVAEYKQLYQFTVRYLRDELEVHNFLYAWSPDRNFTSEAEFLQRYPGDEYVDLVGTDNYWDLRSAATLMEAANKFKIISDYAKRNNKLAALTETGLLNLTQHDWYTGVLLKSLRQHELTLAYVLVWANRKGGFWTPYKGHPAEADFVAFKGSPYVLFGDEMPEIYTIPK